MRSAEELTFASRHDAERYGQLKTQLEQHRAALAAIKREREAILRRANWSLQSIMEREG